MCNALFTRIRQLSTVNILLVHHIAVVAFRSSIFNTTYHRRVDPLLRAAYHAVVAAGICGILGSRGSADLRCINAMRITVVIHMGHEITIGRCTKITGRQVDVATAVRRHTIHGRRIATRTLLALNALVALRTLRAYGTSVTLWALGTSITLRALLSLRTSCSGVALRSLLTGITFRTLRASISLRSLFASITLRSLRSCRSSLTLRSLRTNFALRTLLTRVTLGALRTGLTSISLFAFRSLLAGVTLLALRALFTLLALGASEDLTDICCECGRLGRKISLHHGGAFLKIDSQIHTNTSSFSTLPALSV